MKIVWFLDMGEEDRRLCRDWESKHVAIDSIHDSGSIENFTIALKRHQNRLRLPLQNRSHQTGYRVQSVTSTTIRDPAILSTISFHPCGAPNHAELQPFAGFPYTQSEQRGPQMIPHGADPLFRN